MWKHFCIVPMSIHLLICIKLAGSWHWFGSVPVNLLLGDGSIKAWLSDKPPSSPGWTKVISNAHKSSAVLGGVEGIRESYWFGFVFKLESSLIEYHVSNFAVYLKTSLNPPILPQETPPPRMSRSSVVRGGKAKQHPHKRGHGRGTSPAV